MEALMKPKHLIMVVIALVLVVIAGLLALRKPDIQYKLKPAENLALLNDSTAVITLEEAVAMMKNGAMNIVFIDVRHPSAFQRGHVLNAVNVPVRDLFAPENQSLFRKIEKAGQTALIYGEIQRQANGPWQMLRQTGFNQVKLFAGTYAQLNQATSDSPILVLPKLIETPLIDTNALRSITVPAELSSPTPPPPPKTAKKRVVPVKREDNSGEGC